MRSVAARFALGTTIAGMAIVLDQVTKLFGVSVGSPENPGVLYIAGALNPGLAFSLPFHWWVWATSLLVLLGLLGMFVRSVGTQQPLILIGLSLLLAGGIGNGIDRLLHGAVIDFIHIRGWTVFNVADLWVLTGLVLFITHELKMQPKDKAANQK